MTVPVVTVLMSVYNGENYLWEAIESILIQTYTNFEFIIIDDGSTDSSFEIIQSIKDPRIRPIKNRNNIGLAASLNTGLKLAKGKFVARMDADDISEAERLYEQVNILNSNTDIGLIGTHTYLIDRKDRVFNTWKPPTKHGDIIKTMRKGNSFCHGSVMLKKEATNTVGVYREKFRYAQDYDFWLRISEHYRTANIDKLLYRNRRTSDTISRKNLSNQMNFHLLARELSKERRQTGHDSLALIHTKNLESTLISRFRLSKQDISLFKSEIYFRKFTEAFKTSDYMHGLGFWFNSFLLAPGIYNLWFLFKKIGGLALNKE